MTEVEKLFELTKDKNVIKQFESDYGRCFLQESAFISTDKLTFFLNNNIMGLYNYYDENMSGEESNAYEEDCSYFDDFGTGIEGLSFDCSEEEFSLHELNLHVQYSDMLILKEIYSRFERYLDMSAIKYYAKKRGNYNGKE